jgi:Ca2+-binding EF-hand superfamily protein
MASVRLEALRRISRSLFGFNIPRVRSKVLNRGSILLGSCLGLGATGFIATSFWKGRKSNARATVILSCVEASTGMDKETQKKPARRSYRETRFRHFASCEFAGEVFMTPRDFLESLANDQPTARIGLKTLDQTQVERMLKQTPTLKQSSSNLFRKIYENGLVSYAEYLFLLTALTKPRRQFQIAFLMFDRDGNGIVDKEEFQAIQRVVSHSGSGKPCEKTSLLVHFFGLNGNGKLDYPSFANFIDNLQEEVLSMQFNEVSRGLPKISEVQFAKLLIADSQLTSDEKDIYISRVKQRVQADEGITFPQFLEFNNFLNDFNEFVIALRMFTYAKQPVTQDEFQRAVKASTGGFLDPHVVNVVFQIFDIDGDGKLSQGEFIEVLQGRVRKKFKV